jgi:hypothetical protein
MSFNLRLILALETYQLETCMCKMTKAQDRYSVTTPASQSRQVHANSQNPLPNIVPSCPIFEYLLPELLSQMANRRQFRNNQQIGGNIQHSHVQYYPFQPSEVPGTLA